MSKPISYSKIITVDASVIDHFNHVNNLEYIKWALGISKEHWKNSVTADIQNQYGWMILRHELNYLGQAKLHDELHIETWIHDFSTARSTRKTVIKDLKTEKLIFESIANWCFVSLNTQRPTRIPNEILKPFFKDL